MPAYCEFGFAIGRLFSFTLGASRFGNVGISRTKTSLHDNYEHQRPIEDKINEWAIGHEINFDKSNLLVTAEFAKSMLDYGLAQSVFSDEFVQRWADRCLGAHSRIS